MQRFIGFLSFSLFVVSVPAEVHIFVQNRNGLASVNYECTAGEVVRAFALDVTVDRGQILGVQDFFRGPGTMNSQGYGIFPAAFRDHVNLGPGTNINWDANGYTPLAVQADYPANTQMGLKSAGVTLELGTIWDPSSPMTAPGPARALCSLRISERATVSVTTNAVRGGVMAENPDAILSLGFAGAIVQPPEVTGLSVTNGILTIAFAGGELESAPEVIGPWTTTGDASGQHSEPAGNEPRKFYRVRAP